MKENLLYGMEVRPDPPFILVARDGLLTLVLRCDDDVSQFQFRTHHERS